uniref:Caspase a n=1 Tax=Myripristis murdjan TaxID=586833 RepID=A0A667XNI9_9TELE
MAGKCLFTADIFTFDKLFRARRMFVAKISTPVMADLLNDLLADRILNEREREWVFEEHLARADRASCLIDMVRRKGASQELITNLKNIDLLLHNVLFPPVGQADEAGGSRSFNVTCLYCFLGKRGNLSTVIPAQMTSDMVIIKTRVALLINVRNFVNKKWIREGSEKDDAAMATLLTALGYRVVRPETGEPRKYTGEDIDKAVKDFAQLPDLSQTDSVIVVIMSHGKKGAVYGSRGKALNPNEKDDLFPTDNIFEYLNAKNCPALRDKPKVIIINACRGGDSLIFVIETNPGKCLSRSMKLIVVFLCQIHSTSCFVKLNLGLLYLVEVFNTFSHKDHLEELFTKVINRFDQGPPPAIMQVPVKDRCSLSKHFYLFPGL